LEIAIAWPRENTSPLLRELSMRPGELERNTHRREARRKSDEVVSWAADRGFVRHCRPYTRAMPGVSRVDRMRAIATRALDLRAEFEAQLRAVQRLENALRRAHGRDDARTRLDETLEQALTEMLENNRNIRTVLDDISQDAQRRRP
jgi:hypothetical protein